MTQAIITLLMGTVEITDGGKKISAKKGTKISMEARIKTSSNAKVEIEVNGQTYAIHNVQNIVVKDIIGMAGGGSDPTHAGGTRG